MTHGLSKSRYTQFKRCAKALWLEIYKPNEAVKDDATKERLAVGTKVGELAKGYFGCDYEDMTVPLPDGSPDKAKMLERTAEAIARGVENICEAAFSIDGNYCAVDILHKTDAGYEIYEVKSSTSADKENYGWDVAYQKYVLTRCGINVVGNYIVCINNQYVRRGDIDLRQLFKVTDISDAVNKEYDLVADNVQAAQKILIESEPNTPLSMGCHKPHDCEFWAYCTKALPKPSVFDITGLYFSTKLKLHNDARDSFERIRDYKLNAIQRMQVECTLENRSFINKEGVLSFLRPFENHFPLYYLDFESIQPAIPIYDGTRPYQQLPTQFSLHIQDSPRGAVTHKEFLAPSIGNPLRPVAEALCNLIPKDVYVVVYNRQFECTRLRELAKMFPDLANHLLAISYNVKDLLDPFSKGYYYLPAMGGSFSIKSVLPALFPNDPELNYHALDNICQNGGDAMNLFPKLQNMSEEDEQKARRALLDYCRLDTLAMVKVMDKLYEAVGK